MVAFRDLSRSRVPTNAPLSIHETIVCTLPDSGNPQSRLWRSQRYRWRDWQCAGQPDHQSWSRDPLL